MQEDHEFQTSLVYIAKFCLKNNQFKFEGTGGRNEPSLVCTYE
jgi:hypothetical protein